MNRSQPRFEFPNESKTNEKLERTKVEIVARPPILLWRCGGAHYVKKYPHQKGTDHVAQIQEASTVGEVVRSIPKHVEY